MDKLHKFNIVTLESPLKLRWCRMGILLSCRERSCNFFNFKNGEFLSVAIEVFRKYVMFNDEILSKKIVGIIPKKHVNVTNPE